MVRDANFLKTSVPALHLFPLLSLPLPSYALNRNVTLPTICMLRAFVSTQFAIGFPDQGWGEMRILMRIFVALALLCVSTAVAQSGWQTIGDVSSFEKRTDGIEIQAQRGRVRISVLSPTVVCVRYSLQAKFFVRPSFAALPNAFHGETPALRVEDSARKLSLSTGSVVVRIEKPPLRIVFQDAAGNVISQDQPDRSPVFDRAAEGSAFKVWKAMPEDEHYFGLGDKTGPVDHRNLAFSMWDTDIFGWQESTDPLYKDIPFLLAFRNGRFLWHFSRQHLSQQL